MDFAVQTLFLALAQEEIALRLNTGDPSGASIALERHGLSSGASNPEREGDQPIRLLEIRALLAENRTKEARRHLQYLQRTFGSASLRLSDSIVMHALKSVALWKDGHRSQHPQTDYADSGGQLETVLLDLVARKKFDLAEHQGEVPDTKAEQKVLTKKEQRLVALIEVGMSNEQIAKELFLSEATVKWHLHNIYEKLDVKSRTAAVARAHKLALL